MSERKPPPSHPPPSPQTNVRAILEPAVDAEAHAKVHRRQIAGFLAGLTAALPVAASVSWFSSSRRAVRTLESPAPPLPPPPAPAPPPAVTAPAIRPRLLIIVPAEPDLQYELGHALGEYLNHGDDTALAPLAAVDLACIAADEIVLTATAMGKGPMALLLLAGDTQRLVRFDLPAAAPFERGVEVDVEKRIDQRIAIIGSAVRAAVMDKDQVIGVSPRMLAHARVQEIARRARAGYAIANWRTDPGYVDLDLDERLGESGGTTASSEPRAKPLMPDEAAHFAPALLSVAMSVTGEARKSLLGALAEAARRRVVKGEVAGAEWALSGGCGLSFENRERETGVLCGMGHVPERSRRFLHFYTMNKASW